MNESMSRRPMQPACSDVNYFASLTQSVLPNDVSYKCGQRCKW